MNTVLTSYYWNGDLETGLHLLIRLSPVIFLHLDYSLGSPGIFWNFFLHAFLRVILMVPKPKETRLTQRGTKLRKSSTFPII